MKASDVAEAKRTMSKAHFEQEYMASFTTFEGQIYSHFSQEKHVKEFEPSPGLEYFAGLDPGYKDPTALILIAYNPTTGIYHVFDEYQEAQAVTSGHAKVLSEKMLKYGVETIFIDAAAAQFAADLAYTYDIATIRAKKAVNEGIAFIQTIIEQDRLLVSPNCVHTLLMLDQYRWKIDVQSGVEKPEHGIASHMADALRYAIYTYTV